VFGGFAKMKRLLTTTTATATTRFQGHDRQMFRYWLSIQTRW
jgi:hypothetical protein